jgi:thioredoxin-like negative regulator of GroEL
MKEQRRQLQARFKADPNDAQLRQALADHTRRHSEIEIKIFKDRVSHYPTDLKLRYALGSRLFRARQFDAAIPLFQQAQSDGRCRSESRLYLGRCFYEKGFTEQAVGTLQTAIQEADTLNSPLAMELGYWLARGLEASNRLAEAKKAYGDLIQFDYNFRDARSRLEKLVAGGDG